MALAFHPTKPLSVSAANEPGLRHWNWRTGKPAGETPTGKTRAHSLAFRPDGSLLAAAAGSGEILLWDSFADGAEPSRTLTGHRSPAWAVAWDRDGRHLVSGASAGDVILRDGRTMVPPLTLRAEVQLVRSLSFSSTGRWLGAGCYFPDSVLWDLGALRQRFRRMEIDWE